MINTRYIASELRLSHWAKILRDQQESGLSKNAYCEQSDIHHNTFYYWQRKLRDAVCQELLNSPQPEPVAVDDSIVPAGWAICESAPADTSKTLTIEINGCKVLASADTEPELLAKTCKVLMSLC